MGKDKDFDIEKIFKVTDDDVIQLQKDFGWIIDNFKQEDDKKEKEFEKAKREVEEIFSKHIKDNDQISAATIQRKLYIGYAKAAKFIDILVIKKIVTSEFGVRNILNKQFHL